MLFNFTHISHFIYIRKYGNQIMRLIFRKKNRHNYLLTLFLLEFDIQRKQSSLKKYLLLSLRACRLSSRRPSNATRLFWRSSTEEPFPAQNSKQKAVRPNGTRLRRDGQGETDNQQNSFDQNRILAQRQRTSLQIIDIYSCLYCQRCIIINYMYIRITSFDLQGVRKMLPINKLNIAYGEISHLLYLSIYRSIDLSI